ncbi:MAG: peptidase M19 [Gammaproteobacteria bacterium]|nr:MAG: peptidase M19 [Gammaproteobacteria bacterium]
MRILAVLLLVALALMHWVLPGQIEGSMNLVRAHAPYEIREDARTLHESLFVADLHTDSLLWKRDLLAESEIGHVDVPRLQRGNVALQVFSATTKSPSGQNYEENTGDSDNITLLAVAQMWPVRTWTSIYERALYQLEKLHDFAAGSDDRLLVIESAADMRAFVARRDEGENVVAALYLIEGAHPLEGDLDNLDRLFDAGLRIAGLTHFFDNRIGGSLHGQSGEGLTAFGRDVIRRANELGIIIDVAHSSPQMVKDVLDLSTTPVILSHGGVKGLCDMSRNLDDTLMQRIAAQGGLVGIGYWDGAVCDITPTGVVRSIRYAIDLLGVDHVALGSDYDGTTEVLFDTSELAILTQTMLDEGFSEPEIRKVMGENANRFFLTHLPD